MKEYEREQLKGRGSCITFVKLQNQMNQAARDLSNGSTDYHLEQMYLILHGHFERNDIDVLGKNSIDEFEESEE